MSGIAGGEGLDVDVFFVDGQEEVWVSSLARTGKAPGRSELIALRRNSDEGGREQRRTMSGRSVIS